MVKLDTTHVNWLEPHDLGPLLRFFFGMLKRRCDKWGYSLTTVLQLLIDSTYN